ncbi:MAG: DUF3333 domain-containing protein, partial [Rhodobacteraceae bacterium]|nr:DUF3333 domain-containing protein [Paracoccaceae bacterium]
MLLTSILSNGLGAFRQTFFEIPVTLDPAVVDKAGNRNPDEMQSTTTIAYGRLLQQALTDELNKRQIDLNGLEPKDILGLMSKEAPANLRDMALADPSLVGKTVTLRAYANGRVDGFFKGRVTMESAALEGIVTPEQLTVADNMRKAGLITVAFNPGFLFGPDASELRPESAGLGIAILGSAYMMIVVLVLSLPIGVAASIYLEEFAPKNRWTDMIEINIANLAAVPA